METILSLRGISKRFESIEAMRNVSLDVMRGEFLTLLGPSGCGKTTTLRIIAGLEHPDEGGVLLDGEDVTVIPPNKRNVNTVFQSYALFPHMNVAQNIAYGLKIKGFPKEKIQREVANMLDMVKLPGYERRMPTQLSGGQRQRVAIARAMINNPCILLLDEPLGALDLQLRRQMQDELKRLQKASGITFIYITHDQEEALNMSDRIGIMNEGRIEQLGTPDEIYEKPATSFAARFIGQANLIEARVLRAEGGETVLGFSGGEIRAEAAGLTVGDTVTLSIRSERVDYNTQKNYPGFALRGTVTETLYAGGSMRTTLTTTDGQTLTVAGLTREDRLPDGTQVNIFWNPRHAAVIPETPYYGRDL